MTISEDQDDLMWNVQETIQFNCRKNGGNIQKSISWAPNEHERLHSITMSIRLPESEEDREIFRARAEGDMDVGEEIITKLKEGIKFDAITVPNLSQKITTIDKLGVKIETAYTLKRYSAITWSFVLPTNRFHLTVLADKKYEMVHEMFCANENGLKIDRSDGLLLLHYRTGCYLKMEL